jgi:hypothetical protein
VRRLLSIALAQAEAIKVVLQCIGLAFTPASRQLTPVGLMDAPLSAFASDLHRPMRSAPPRFAAF